MKKYITILLMLILGSVVIHAQTNQTSLTETNKSEEKEYGSVEITLGAAGTTINGKSSGGFDFSVSVNPFKKASSIWVGIVQGMYWEPEFSGSTDVFADWVFPIYKDTVYLQPGWSVGAVYDSKSTEMWRTGPELTLQYWVGESSFVYVGANYDLFVSKGDSGLRYSCGIGFSF